MNELPPIKASMRVRAHSFLLESREKAVITGVDDVESFNENEIMLTTSAGFLSLRGQALHITKLSLDEGQLIVEGLIDGIEYSEHDAAQRSGWLGRMFR